MRQEPPTWVKLLYSSFCWLLSLGCLLAFSTLETTTSIGKLFSAAFTLMLCGAMYAVGVGAWYLVSEIIESTRRRDE